MRPRSDRPTQPLAYSHFAAAWPAVALLVLAASLAGAEEMGPPAPPQERIRRVYEAAGFDGVDDQQLRRELDRSLELYILAAGADFATTHYALDRGGEEANPLIRERTLVAPVKVVAVYGTLRVEGRLRRTGHDGWADVVRWGFMVLNLGAATWNIAASP